MEFNKQTGLLSKNQIYSFAPSLESRAKSKSALFFGKAARTPEIPDKSYDKYFPLIISLGFYNGLQRNKYPP